MSVDDVSPVAAKKPKSDNPNSATSALTGSKNDTQTPEMPIHEPIEFSPSHSHKDAYVLGTHCTFEELRSRHLEYLAEEERAMQQAYGTRRQ
jgi:hypothetical protein